MSDDASKTGPVTDRVRAAVESRIERLEGVLTLAVRQSEAIRRKHFGGLDRMLTERAAIVESLVNDAAAFEAMAREVAGTMDERLLERLGPDRAGAHLRAQDRRQARAGPELRGRPASPLSCSWRKLSRTWRDSHSKSLILGD